MGNSHGGSRQIATSMTELDDSTVINQGTWDARAPQLAFHTVHGQNIELKQGGRIARRKESFCKGLAFSNRPIVVNENVCLRLSEVVTNWSGVLRFGITNVNPETYRNIAVPKFACPDLTAKDGYWAKALPERFSVEGNILHFFVTEEGELMYGINGVHKGTFLIGINTTLPMWILVDIYGNSVACEFIGLSMMISDAVDKLKKYKSILLSQRSFDECTKKEKESSELKKKSTLKKKSSEFRTTRARASSAAPRISATVSPSLDTTSTQHQHELSAIPTSIPTRGLEPVRFHNLCGNHIMLSSNRTVATRAEQEYTQGYVFTEKPLANNERVYIQILATQQLYNGGLAFGVTCADPASLRTVDLPEDSSDLLEFPDYWVGIKDIALQPQKNTVLSFWITDKGEVKFEKGNSGSRTVFYVDNTLQLYMWFDCYGSTQAIKLWGSTRVNSSGIPLAEANSTSSSNEPTTGTTPVKIATNLRVNLRPATSGGPTTSRTTALTEPSTHSIPRPPALPPRRTVDDLLGGPPIIAVAPMPIPPRPRTSRMPLPFGEFVLPAPPSRPPPAIPTSAVPVLTPSLQALSITSTSSTPNFAVRNSTSPSPSPLASSAASSPIAPRSPAPNTLSSLNFLARTETTVIPPPAASHSAPALAPKESNPSGDDLEASEECTVCMSARIDSVVYTCGHMCMCYGCAQVTFKSTGLCPLCRTQIKDVIKIFKA